MFNEANSQFLRVLAEERHEALRRSAQASRLRREVRRPRAGRRRHRSDPDR